MTQDNDIFKFKSGVDPGTLTVYLAWDEKKAFYVPRSASSERDECLGMGVLWRWYKDEIVKHIMEIPS